MRPSLIAAVTVMVVIATFATGCLRKEVPEGKGSLRIIYLGKNGFLISAYDGTPVSIVIDPFLPISEEERSKLPYQIPVSPSSLSESDLVLVSAECHEETLKAISKGEKPMFILPENCEVIPEERVLRPRELKLEELSLELKDIRSERGLGYWIRVKGIEILYLGTLNYSEELEGITCDLAIVSLTGDLKEKAKVISLVNPRTVIPCGFYTREDALEFYEYVMDFNPESEIVLLKPGEEYRYPE